MTSLFFALMAASCAAELNEGLALVQRQQARRAVEVLERASKTCASSAPVFDLLGIASDLLGNSESAQLAFRKAIEIDPKAARPRINLAVSLFRSGKEIEALHVLEEAIRLEPGNSLANANLGAYYARRGECGQSLEYFEAAGAEKSALVREDPRFRLAFLQCLLASEQRERAMALLPSAWDQSPPALRFSLGVMLAERGLYHPAIEQFEAIPEPERDAAVWFNLGLAHSRLRQYDLARRYYFAAIDSDGGHTEAYFRIGLDFAEQGDGAKSIPWLWRARRMSEQRTDIAAALAEQLIAGHYFQSAGAILDAVRTTTRDPLLQVARADLAWEQGRASDAATWYRRALDLDPASGVACAGLARVLASQGRESEAAERLRAFLASEPADPAANAELGRLELQQGNWVQALPKLEKAWEANPSDLKLALDLARCYRKADRAAKAVELLRPLRSRGAEKRAYHYELAQAYTSLKSTLEAEWEFMEIRRLEKSDHEDLRFTPPVVYIH